MKRSLGNLFGFGKIKPLKARRSKTFRPALEALEARIALSTVNADFNGDGVDDLAIGFPNAMVSNAGVAPNAGAVQVLYGVDGVGLGGADAQFLRDELQQPNSFFGQALAAGDFDGDGYDDLAVGIPGKDLGANLIDAGAVMVFYGSADGLRLDNRQLFHEGATDAFGTVLGEPAAEDNFGYALAAGDFDGDGVDDLAIGVPDDDGGGGAVNVLFGVENDGLTSVGDRQLRQGSQGVLGTFEGGVTNENGVEIEEGDHFGTALAAGDFNGDGRDDLAIGVPDEDVSGQLEAGAVNIVLGIAGGLATTGNQFWTQNSFVVSPSGTMVEVLDQAEAGDHFGFSLTAGDFNGDGRSDLAIGVPDENIGAAADTGAVNVIYGSLYGLMGGVFDFGLTNQFLHQDRAGVAGANEMGDQFGFALAAGDFNGDGDVDLAVGTPGEDLGGVNEAGAVIIILGEGGGLAQNGSLVLSQSNDNHTATQLNTGDQFGYALAVGDFNGDGRDDLAVGIPYENAGKPGYTRVDSGQVEAIYFDDSGLSVEFARFYDWSNLSANQNAPWGSFPREFQMFGSAL